VQTFVHKKTEFVMYSLGDRQPMKVVPKCSSGAVELSSWDSQVHSGIQNRLERLLEVLC